MKSEDIVFLFYKIWRFIVQKILGIYIYFWVYIAFKCSFSTPNRCSLVK